MRARCLVALVTIIMFVSGCGGDSDIEILAPDVEVDDQNSATPRVTAVGGSEPSTDQVAATTESTGFRTIKVSDPTSDQVTQWMKTILPLITEDGSGLVPATCDEGGWISGVIVLPAWVRDGEFDTTCSVGGGIPLFINMVGNTCFVDEEWTEETLIEDCIGAVSGDFAGDAPSYETILTVNGEEISKPTIVVTEKFIGTPPVFWDVGGEQSIAFAGYNALLELPPGRYTIVAGYRSLDDDSANTTVTLDLTVRD